MPRGSLSGTLTVEGAQAAVEGVGYHDHNWGTAPLRKLVEHWYWGRARIGDYTVVTLNFISHPDYGHNCHPAFMVAKGGEILASGERDIEFSATDIHPNATTGAQVANCLRYTYRDAGASFAVCFERDRDVFTLDFGKAGAYHRFVGDVTLEHQVGGELIERVSADALWELLDFRPRTPGATAPAASPQRSLVHRA